MGTYHFLAATKLHTVATWTFKAVRIQTWILLFQEIMHLPLELKENLSVGC